MLIAYVAYFNTNVSPYKKSILKKNSGFKKKDNSFYLILEAIGEFYFSVVLTFCHGKLQNCD